MVPLSLSLRDQVVVRHAKVTTMGGKGGGGEGFSPLTSEGAAGCRGGGENLPARELQ